MSICDRCAEQKKKLRYADPHDNLKPIGERREFRGGMTGGYEEQDYVCETCGAEFAYSNDKNDYGWMLSPKAESDVSSNEPDWVPKLKGCFGVEDKKFGLHPLDGQRGKELKEILDEQGVKWAQVEVQVHKLLEGCTPEHLEEQTKVAKRLLCFGIERK